MALRPSFTATFEFDEIQRLFDLGGEAPSFKPRYNVQPAQYMPVILRGKRGTEAKLMKWGLVPSWLTDISMWDGLPYAQAETLMEKRSFKRLVESRRCLIPADGFFEWRNNGKKKIPIWYHLQGKKPFVFAGLWDSWRNIELGDTVESFTIITTRANALIRPIRNRMPVIFDREGGFQWLDLRLDVSRYLSLVLTPFPSEFMQGWEVASSVEFVENDSLDCIKPVGGASATITAPARKFVPLPIVSPYARWKK